MVVVRQQSISGRKIWRPTHTWNTRQALWQITPFLIAPVIPGETMRSGVFQVRAVSAPVKNDLLGWWLEHYVFYVKLRDFNLRDDITSMFVNPDFVLPSSLKDNTANAKYYHNGRNRINYAKLCLERVTEEYFRDEGEAAGVATYDGLPLAKLNTESVFDSIMSEDDYQVPGDIDVDADADGTITAREVEEAKRQWELLRSMNLTEQTYEDFIRSFGVRGAVVERVDPHRPELIRYEKSWTYPSNTVEVSGIRSVASWSQNFCADKDRFFIEPGFIFGVMVYRLKIYLGNQSAAAVQLLDHIQTWLPAVLRDDPYTSLVHVPDGTGPVGTDPTGYYVDIRDLYLRGDQFVNHTEFRNEVAIPRATNFDKEYAASVDIEGLFVGSASAADRHLRQDGIATFMIASADTKDYTARTGASIAVTPA